MAYPWNAGDTLNAADLNAYAGLVYMKTVAVGTAVTSVGVTGLTGFDVYRFVFDRIDPSGGTLLNIDDAVSLTGSDWQGTVLLWNRSTSPVLYASTNSAAAYFALMDTSKSAASLTVYGLNTADRTRFTAESQYDNGFAIGGGFYNNNTIATTLTFSVSSGTMTGGNIHIYGYNT